MCYYQKELLINKILEEKIDIDNLFIVMPRGVGRSYWLNKWQEMRLQLLKKLWQEFELKYFYIINHRRYMINTELYKWLLEYKAVQGTVLDFEQLMERVFTTTYWWDHCPWELHFVDKDKKL